MDNNEVYALFEDIKSGLKSINNKLENTPKVSNNQSDGQPPAMDLAPIKELLNTSARENREQTKAILTKFGANGQVNEPQEHIHRHSFDIRSSKVFSFLVGMGVVCGLSIWGNIELWQSKHQYADDALKFRVIRSWGGCDAKTILWLNDVLDIRRDEETIEWLRQEADGYDRDLKAVSDSLMQEKLKVEQITNNKK